MAMNKSTRTIEIFIRTKTEDEFTTSPYIPLLLNERDYRINYYVGFDGDGGVELSSPSSNL